MCHLLFPAEKATQQRALAPPGGWGAVMSSRSTPHHIGTIPAWCSSHGNPPGSQPDTALLGFILHPVLKTVALHGVRNVSRQKHNNPQKSSSHRLYSAQWPLSPRGAPCHWMGAGLKDSFLRWRWLLHSRYPECKWYFATQKAWQTQNNTLLLKAITSFQPLMTGKWKCWRYSRWHRTVERTLDNTGW